MNDKILLKLRDVLMDDENIVGMFRRGFNEAGRDGVLVVLEGLLIGLGRDHKLSILLGSEERERLADALALDHEIDLVAGARFAAERRADVAGHCAEMREFGLWDGS